MEQSFYLSIKERTIAMTILTTVDIRIGRALKTMNAQ